MHIFLDTANIDQVRKSAKLGIVSGLTTNPSLVSKERMSDYKAVIKEICSIIPGPVSAEVVSTEAQAMIEQARDISTWAPNVVIKIPATTDGLEAISILAKEGVKVNFTLCFSLNQAILGALAGATYVSIFVGRLDDVGHDGIQVVEDIINILDNYPELDTQVIAASLRHPLHCTAAAMVGAPIATVPYNVLMQMIQHPLTDVGIKRFLADWKSVAKQ